MKGRLEKILEELVLPHKQALEIENMEQYHISTKETVDEITKGFLIEMIKIFKTTELKAGIQVSASLLIASVISALDFFNAWPEEKNNGSSS